MSRVSQVRESSQWVAEQASHVSIRVEKIEEYTASLLERYKDSFVTDLEDEVHYVSEDREDTLRYLLVLDTLNFGSAYFNLARDMGINLRYTVFASALKEAFKAGELNTPDKWRVVTEDVFFSILPVEKGQHPKIDELIGLFVQNIKAVGEIVQSQYSGQVSNLIESVVGSAVQLVDTVAEWSPFKDVSTYKGREVPVLKRAQILAADIQLVYKCFDDIGQVTMFADNDVPHVLRYDGILEYTPELASKIDAKEPLESGSEEEVELRCLAIHTVELMVQAAQRQGHSVNAMNIDHLLWNRGQEEEIYNLPKHRTFSTNY